MTSIAATSNRPALATTNQQPSLAASTNLTVTQLPNTSTHAEDWSNISSYGDSFQGFQARSPPSLSPEASLNFTEDNVTDVGNNFLIPQEIRDLLTSRRLGGGGRSNRHQLSHYFDAQLQNLRSAPAFRRDISVQEAGDLSVQEFTFPEANIFPYMVVTQPQIRLRHPSSSANIAAPTNLSATVARNNSKFNDLLSYASSKMKERKVYIISCIDCEKTVTYRGMRALLLANKKRSLYSSDSPILK